MTKKGKILGPHTAAQLGLSENHIFVDTRSNLFACLSKNVLVRDLQHRFNVIDFAARDIDTALVETGATSATPSTSPFSHAVSPSIARADAINDKFFIVN